jgi:hypothetical protein
MNLFKKAYNSQMPGGYWGLNKRLFISPRKC